MKNNIEIKKLGEVCQFYRGLTYSKSDEVAHSKNAVLRANNINLETNTLNFEDIRYISDEIIIPESKKPIKDSVMICTASGSRSHLGKVAFIDKDYDYAFGGFMGLLVPDSKIIDPKYFFTILTSGQFRDHINSLTAGANINNLKFSQIQDYPIAVPPLSEQKRIVKMLNEKFEVIEKLKKVTDKQLADVKELFESELNNEFSQLLVEKELVLMSDIYDVRDGTHDSPKYHKEGRALVTSKNLKDGKLLLDNVKYVSESDYIEICKRSGVSVGDVLFAMIGTIGNPVVITQEPDFAIKNVALFKVPNEQSSEFLRYYLLSNYVKDKMARESKGATQKFVGLGYLRSFLIPQVDYKEQVRIVSKLNGVAEQLNQLRKIYQGKVIDLEELKKSYLEQAFSGKL